MKITEIHVDCFGHWKDLELPAISAELTVIHGPNEAGKSTLLHLIRAILYGFSAQHHARFIPPRHAGPVGGWLEVSGPTGRFTVRRRLPEGQELREVDAGELTVRSVDGPLQGRHLLGSLLSGVDDAIFRNVFAVGLSELQQLATLSDTEAAQQLYGLAAGTDRVAVADVARRLDALRQQRDDDREESLRALTLKRQQLKEGLEREKDRTQQWLQLRKTRQEIEDEIARLEKRRQRLGEPMDLGDGGKQIRSQWKRCRQLHQQLKSLGPLPDVSADAVSQLNHLARQLRERRKSWEQLRDRRRQLREQAHDGQGHRALLHHAEVIQTLQHRSAAIGQLAKELEQSNAQLEETEFELQAQLERLGLKSDWRRESLPLITDEMIDRLRGPSHDAREARREREAAEQAERDGLESAEKAARRLAERLKLDGPIELSELVESEERRIALLQQRMQRQGELDTANRHQREAREQYHEWSQRQLLPWRGLMGLGLIFSVGVVVLCVALFAGFFRISTEQRTSVGLVGLAICGLAVSIKEALEFAASRGAARSRNAISTERKKVDRIVDDICKLEAQLPAGQETTPFAEQLQQAVERRQALNELEPLERQRIEALQQVERAREEKERAERRYQHARQAWRDRLHEYGLPSAMTPKQFQQLIQPESSIGRLRRRLIELHQKVESQRGELQDVQDRLRLVFERTGHVPESDCLDEQIQQLHRLLQESRQAHQQRESLHRTWRELGRQQNEIARTALRLQAKRKQLVTRFGVDDVQELKRAVRRRQQAEAWRTRRDRLLAEISERLGKVCTLNELRKSLDADDFERRLAKWQREQEETSGRLAELHERRGELGQQIKDLAAPPRAFNKRLQLQELEALWNDQAARWQTLTGIAATLNHVRQSYESDRQPESLAEASGYLKQLTQSRYQRIWTPFGESSLCVDDRHGKPIRVEHLSRGTREQVFLSLRLALAAAYGRRGALLPVILDDVFVNFDAERLRCAAETIVQFASAGHQVLVFTCHDHIRDLFTRMGVDLRQLPDADQHARSPQPVLPVKNEVPSPPPVISEVPRDDELPSDLPPGLPTEGDPELDYELLYGAPEYEPGYEIPRLSSSIGPRRRRRPRRRPRPVEVRRPAPPIEEPVRSSRVSAWGQVAEYVPWFPPQATGHFSAPPDTSLRRSE